MLSDHIKAGSTVRLKPSVNHHCPEDRENNQTAIVTNGYGATNDQIMLDRYLRGCPYWNRADLELDITIEEAYALGVDDARTDAAETAAGESL